MRNLRKVLGFATLIVALALSANGQTSQDTPTAPSAKHCADLTSFRIPGMALAITKAQAFPTTPAGTVPLMPPMPEKIMVSIPPYCQAEGVIDERVGVDGKPYGIGFAIALPDNWNGRFLFQGGGGFNGSIRPPFGIEKTGDAPALAQGFAVVSTDSGHKGAVFDGYFFKDQQATLNFAYAAVGTVTIAAKQIVAHYYGRPAKYSYFAGCSTGGREGMLMSQRYPSYFDGIVSGDPAMDAEYSRVAATWAAVAFNQIAPKDPDGKPDPTRVFSATDRKLLQKAILDACDAQDGVTDGMIFNTAACHFDPAVLKCKAAKNDTCLTAQQVSALKSAVAGPKDSSGRQVYPPYPYDVGLAAERVGGIPGFLPSSGPDPLGPPNLDLSVDTDQAVAALRADGRNAITDTLWTNLSTFSGHGGKILFFHGMSDPWFSAFDTSGYYDRLVQENGGLLQAQGFSRLFLVPGMGHCRGGDATLDNFDLLGAVVNWVEKGIAPDAVVATGKAFPGRSRPLCAYPKYAHYKGQGDPDNAASFECRD